MWEIYWETTYTVSAPPHFCGEQHSAPNFELGDKKKVNAWGDLKSSFHWYLSLGGREGVYCVFCQKECKIKYGFEDPIPNADIGLFQLPNNQLMFSFVTIWFWATRIEGCSEVSMLLLNMCNMLELPGLVVCLRWTC